MVAAQGDLHLVDGLETAFLLWRGDQCWLRGADREDTRLRRVDNGREVGNAVHAQIGDGEGATLQQ